MTRHVELSHVIEDGLVTYPGLPSPIVCDYLSHEASRGVYGADTEFQIGRIEMVSNTGTYLDTPFHRYRDGADLAAVTLDRLAGLAGVLVHAHGTTEIDADAFAGLEVSGRAVLVHTGWDAHWGAEEYLSGRHPYLTAGAAELLADEGAALVGIDSMNIDSTADQLRPVHTTLLGRSIPIVEHLTGLGDLPPDGFTFTAAPPRIRGMGTFPVRAFATIVDGSQ